MSNKTTKEQTAESIATLRALLVPGATVYTILKHVSSSGMTRRLSLVVAGKDGTVQNITWDAARAMGYPVQTAAGYVQDVGLTVQGCGQDMGFNTVYNLSRVLFPDGFGVEGHTAKGKRQRFATENDARRALSRGYIFGGRNGDASGWDNDGGYALLQRWL